MASPRSKARIEARIKERVAYCLEFEINDPRATFITLTRVEVSGDLGLAKIYYTVLGEESERSQVAHMLESAKGFVRRQLGRVLQIKRMPSLSFFYDEAMEEAVRVDKAITDALHRDRVVNGTAEEDVLEDPDESGDAGTAP